MIKTKNVPEIKEGLLNRRETRNRHRQETSRQARLKNTEEECQSCRGTRERKELQKSSENGSFKDRAGKNITGMAISCQIQTGTFSYIHLEVHGDL